MKGFLNFIVAEYAGVARVVGCLLWIIAINCISFYLGFWAFARMKVGMQCINLLAPPPNSDLSGLFHGPCWIPHPEVQALPMITLMLISGLGGYVAACLSGQHAILLGAVSSIFLVAMVCMMSLGVQKECSPFYIAGTLFGVLGGYLRKKTVKPKVMAEGGKK